MKRTPYTTALALSLAALGSISTAGLIGASSADAATPATSAVYISTNATGGNAIQTFLRQSDGSLVADGAAIATGGTGSGAAGGQGSVTLANGGKTIYTVDSGSNQVSELTVASNGLPTLTSVVASNGVDPISVAVKGNLVVVLNAGSSSSPANVTSFLATKNGLAQLGAGSQPLGAGTSSPEDVTITPNGTEVVVTEKGSDTIDTFAIGADYVLGQAVTTSSNGPGAYAQAYVRNQLLVAGAGADSTLSSFLIATNGAAVATEAALPDSQAAACWIATTSSGYAFVANAASSSISTYRVLRNGGLAFFGNTVLPGAVAAKPLDVTTSSDGKDLYVVDEANSQVDSYAIGTNGTLTLAGTPAPVAAGPRGIAAN